MREELKRYINGEVNVIKDEFILGRERTGRAEMISVSVPDIDKPIYSLWRSLKKKSGAASNKPRHTGGKASYIMFFPDKAEQLREVSLEALGFAVRLFNKMEWNTGRLCTKRGNPLTKEMLAEMSGVGILKAKTILKELTDAGVLVYNMSTKAYHIEKIARKGGSRRHET